MEPARYPKGDPLNRGGRFRSTLNGLSAPERRKKKALKASAELQLVTSQSVGSGDPFDRLEQAANLLPEPKEWFGGQNQSVGVWSAAKRTSSGHTIFVPSTKSLHQEGLIREAGRAIADEAELRGTTVPQISVEEHEMFAATEKTVSRLKTLMEHNQKEVFGRLEKKLGRSYLDLSSVEQEQFDKVLERKCEEVNGELQSHLHQARTNLYDLTASYTASVKSWRDDHLAVLTEIRPFGGALNNVSVSESWHSRALSEATTMYPTDWVATSENSGRMLTRTTSRASYWPDRESTRGVMLLSPYSEPINAPTGTVAAVHELGHRFEHVMPHLRRAEWAFYHRRTHEGIPTIGKPRGKIELDGYRSDEKFVDGNFRSVYAGKSYGAQPYSDYEILSVGAESIYSGDYRFYNDADYKHFTLGLLALG